MNQPRVHVFQPVCMSSPCWTPLPPPSKPHPSGSSQSTSFECPASCIKLALVIYFTYGSVHVSMLFSQIIPALPPGHTHWGNQNGKRHVYPSVHRSTVCIARTGKQLRCPSTDEWITKFWYTHTMEYYSAIKKKNTFESVLIRWMKLEPIIQSEVSEKEKHQYGILTHIYGI